MEGMQHFMPYAIRERYESGVDDARRKVALDTHGDEDAHFRTIWEAAKILHDTRNGEDMYLPAWWEHRPFIVNVFTDFHTNEEVVIVREVLSRFSYEVPAGTSWMDSFLPFMQDDGCLVVQGGTTEEFDVKLLDWLTRYDEPDYDESCDRDGYSIGREDGFKKGYAEGLEAGIAIGAAEVREAIAKLDTAYLDGYADGWDAGESA